MVITEDEAKEIETNTRNQADSELWLTERRKRQTASRVGNIAKMRKTTKLSTKVKNILYGTFRGNNATRYGIANEDKARQEYITYEGEVVLIGMWLFVGSLFVLPNPGLQLALFVMLMTRHTFLDCLK